MIERIKKIILDRALNTYAAKIKFNESFNKKMVNAIVEYDKQYFAALKNKYKGRAGFVVGNGPSLQIADLDKLKQQITIASNKIFLAFKETDWRPTFYTMADPLEFEKYGRELINFVEQVHIPHYLDWHKSSTATRVFRSLGLSNDGTNKVSKFYDTEFSDDLSIGAFSGYTVTMENLQLAVHIGLNPIFLIGCDHNYAQPVNVNKDEPIVTLGNNHFIKGYHKNDEKVYPAMIDLMERSYKQAKYYSDKSGIKIYNATRGGKLEIFDRITYEEALKMAVPQKA